MKTAKTVNALMELNKLARRCGCFCNAYLRDGISYNNGYNCDHPDCEESQEGVGGCFSWSCPLAYEADEEDCEKFGVEFEEGEFMIAEIPEDEFDENHMWKQL